MTRTSSKAELESEVQQRDVRIRAAIKEDHDLLLRSIAVLVAKSGRSRHWPEVMEIASETLHEAVQEALRHVERFDPTRSAAAWVRGIAAKLLLNRQRAEGRVRRLVPVAVLGDEAWATVLGQHCTGPTDEAVAGRLDLEQALARISTEERRAIEFRYYKGLDGERLARALGVSTPGAARVRVCRALQALRTHFAPAEEEVFP